MVKNTLLILVTILAVGLIYSCSPAMHTATVKLNDLDSVIRIVNPNHNCGCNWGDKKYKLYTGGTFSKYNYFWQANYVKHIDSIDILNDSKKIKDQILKLEPTFNEYNRFFLEYRITDNTNIDTTIKYKVIGTWISYKNGCSGFVKDISAKKLEKKSALNSFKEKLCK
jgi:hypothetical protein